MPPILMTRPERAALNRLARAPAPVADVKPQYADKLVHHGLAIYQALRLTITPKGQLEILRQRYRRMTTRTVTVTQEDFRTQFDRRLRAFLANAPADRDAAESDTAR